MDTDSELFLQYKESMFMPICVEGFELWRAYHNGEGNWLDYLAEAKKTGYAKVKNENQHTG